MTEIVPMAESRPQDRETARAPISIAGAGNWLVSWDRIGPRVLELLEGRFPGSEVELVDLGSAGLALLDALRAQELLILVDASNLGGEPGSIRELSPDLTGSFQGVLSAHQVGMLETLALAKLLFPETLPRETIAFLVETTGLGEARQEQVCREVVARVCERVERWARREA